MSKGFKPVVKRKLILPVLKMEQNKPIYIKVEDKVYVGKNINGTKADQKEKPADLCHVTDLETGEMMLIIVPAVVLSVWNEEYPNAGYVGLGFAITKGEKAKEKRYFQYTVDELELSGEKAA